MASSPCASGRAASRSAHPHSSVSRSTSSRQWAHSARCSTAHSSPSSSPASANRDAAEASSRLARSRSVLVTATPATSSPSGARADGGRQPFVQPGQALDRRGQVLGPALAAEHGAQVVVGLGRGQQLDGPVQVAARERQPAAALCLSALVGRQLVGQPVGPHGVDGVPAGVVAGGQRHGRHQVVEVDARPPGRVEEGLVGAAEGGDHRHGLPGLGSEGGQHLLAQEVVDGVACRRGPQLDQSRPAAEVVDAVDRDVAQRGEGGEVVVGEGEVGLVQPFDPALGRQPGQRHRRLDPAAEHDVAVGRQDVHERGQQTGGLAVADLVDVVDDQAHLARRPAPHRVDQGGGQHGDVGGAPVVGRALGDAIEVGAEGAGEPGGQVPRVVVARSAAQPAVVAARGEGVLVHRLGQQRRLAEPRPGDHDRDGELPASLDAPEQVAPPDERTARPRRSVAVGPRHAEILRPERAPGRGGSDRVTLARADAGRSGLTPR